MKKFILTGGAVAVLTLSLITAQTTYACFCIPGIFWESACGQQPGQIAQPTTTATATPTPTPTPTAAATDTTSADTSTTDTTATDTTPTVVTASTTTATTMPVAATVTSTPLAKVTQLPETGTADGIGIMAALGALGYATTYLYLRFVKR